MAASKAGINSQSGNRLDDLEAVVAAMQAQIDELGGGQLVTTFFSGMIFLNPTALNPINIPTPPAGQRVVLEGLTTSVAAESNVSVVGSVSGAVISDKILSNAVASGVGRFSVGTNVAGGGAAGAGIITKLVFEPDETVSITKTGANWASTVFYSYSYAKDA